MISKTGIHDVLLASSKRMSERDRLNALTEQIIAAAIAVHHELGPGMLESAYEACLTYELLERGLAVERQKPPTGHIPGSDS